jgi:hypothetical protein
VTYSFEWYFNVDDDKTPGGATFGQLVQMGYVKSVNDYIKKPITWDWNDLF